MSVVTVPDVVWKWAQRQSGNINPGNWIRENVLLPAMIAEIGEEGFTAIKEDRWAEIGMEVNPMDTEFTAARDAWVAAYGGEEKSIAFFKERTEHGIHSPRAWLMSWWNKQKPQEVKTANEDTA